MLSDILEYTEADEAAEAKGTEGRAEASVITGAESEAAATGNEDIADLY